MKKFFYILLLAIFACSPDNEDAILEQQSTSSDTLESMNLESEPGLNGDPANLIYTETFENPELYKNPQAGDFYLEHITAPHSFNLNENIKRYGNSAGRFGIKKNDPKLYGGYRSEMAQVTSTTLEEGWYGFSQYFPDSYISDATEEVVGQWHDQPDIGETTARSPSNAIITGNDRIRWMIRWDSTRIKQDNNSEGLHYIDLGKIPKNKWIDWVVHIKYSHTNTGILEVWMDGVKVIDRQNMPNSYNDEKYPYFKFGVYKWKWGTAATQRVIYYDEVRIGDKNSSYEEVKPNGSEELAPLESRINMMVNSYTVGCVGEIEGTCLLVQEGDMIGTENWENFYFSDRIEGFNYEPGYVYGLIVKKTEVENPPLGGSSIKYELVEIVSKEAQ
ncbi:protein of unknown function [Salegentibacter salegens]|uniref:DUF4377 domain-containing protein n=2 Tax=Salegentibacter salegens TaxID=143223 RepID=A0A1M7NJL1_9FLAO|nr:heparin lyase I family protein [Salegentibacter salegens]SHN04112.1 protein of unknown function [Salegentibacter salegens]